MEVKIGWAVRGHFEGEDARAGSAVPDQGPSVFDGTARIGLLPCHDFTK